MKLKKNIPVSVIKAGVMGRLLRVTLSLFIPLFGPPLFAQATEDMEIHKSQQDTENATALELFENPSFGIYRDNYFITGIPTNKGVNKHTADAKFQISIRQRLTKATLPFNTFLMFTYTQKSFWNIYESSLPFKNNDYNPGLTIGKPMIRNNKILGTVLFAFEHESNGRDSVESRDWNYFTLSGVYFHNIHFSAQAKVWYGWALYGENPDLFKYKGYGLVALNYRNRNDLLGASLVVNPSEAAINTQMEIYFKPYKKGNQYLFLQWYQGYGENLLDYNKYLSMVRIGISIRPSMADLY